MKLYDGGLIFFGIVAALVIVGYGSKHVVKTKHHTGKEEFKGHDNFIEELAESALEKKLNLPEGSIDFTPDSPEKAL